MLAHHQHLVADRAVHGLVDLRELLQAGLHVRVHAGDELELRLAEVGGDARVGERRAQRRRMRREGEAAVGPHAQRFLLDAATDARKQRRVERTQSFLEGFQAARSFDG